MPNTTTTITVEGVDDTTWREFQKLMIDKYGTLDMRVGQEITNALVGVLNQRGTEPKKVDFEKYLLKPDVPRVLDDRGTLSIGDLISDAMRNLGGEATIQEVYAHIRRKYGNVNSNSVATSMSDLSDNGPISSPYSRERRILHRVGRGRYELLGKKEELRA